MYIKEVKIENIKSISHLEMKFDNCAGWHVIIGDNGAGKSTFIKSLSTNLLDISQLDGLRINWNEWVKKNCLQGEINLKIYKDSVLDKLSNQSIITENENIINSKITIKEVENNFFELFYNDNLTENNTDYHFISSNKGWFSVAYGPFRRFSGGDKEMDELMKNNKFAKLAAHLTAFKENISLSESIEWLKDLRYKQLENIVEGNILNLLKDFVNNSKLLPHNLYLDKIGSEGVFFKDGNNSYVSINELSDGHRSILSLTFELIRQLIRVYGNDLVFNNINQKIIDLPGIVLIDEIDAHLHPTWQKEIGFWFTKYFPKLQFIVTTHSPLVCRAVENGGSIWRLPTPGTNQNLYKIEGKELNNLIYGNILDAFSTEVFGKNILRSQSSNDKIQKLAQLNVKKIKNILSLEEEIELQELKLTFPSNSNITNYA